MLRKPFLALVATTSVLAGCTSPPAAHSPVQPSARLGTVAPAYPVGDLEPGVEVLEKIPTDGLSTTESVPFAGTDLCKNMPADVIAPIDAATPVIDNAYGCVWRGTGVALDIGAEAESMAKDVEWHIAMANGGAEPLAHLAWLRVGGHYTIERILKSDPSQSCWLTLDVSSPATFHVTLYRIDPTTGEAVKSDTGTSVSQLCPVAREIARNLLDHIDDQRPSWWETVIHPTE